VIVLQDTIDYLIKNQMAVELDRLMGVNLDWEKKEIGKTKYYKLNSYE
jgi:hypothetical protein